MAQILFNWLTPLRWIFLAIDSLLFGLIDGCYTIIISFANAELFTTEQIAELRTKIYFVITLIAFFRLAFLLVNSLINPDKLTDENEGLSKIAFNFVIMLVLLVVTPIIFNIALEFQKEVVNGNVITGIFSLSNSSGYSCNDTYTDKQLEIDRNDYKTEEDYLNEKEHKKAAKCSSDKMKGLVISSLIYPDSKIAHEEDGKYAINDDVTCTGSCKDAIEAYNTMTEDGYYDFLTLEKYIAATGEVNDSEVFAYNYTLIITTICAGFIVYILLSFAFDLGKRLLELNLLMILSPLFIATYVDPKSAKSGPFNNWLKAIGKSYVSLFLKLAALAVMLLFIKILSINKVGLKPIGPIGFIILLFAGLTFCKELPKWLGGLLGSEGGMGELGLGKKLGATPLLGGAAKKAGLMATGALAGAATSAAALGRQRRQIRSQARKDAGLGRILNTEGRKAALEGEKGLKGYKNLRAARKKAYDSAFKNAGLTRKASGTVGQGLMGMYLGAKSGGATGIKADNIKGAFKGSVQSAKQGLSSVGVSGGTTLGQRFSGGILSGESKLTDKAFGTFEDRDKRAKKLENDKLVQSFAASGIVGSGYGQGQIAMSRADKNSIVETKAFGDGDCVKSYEDYLAAQYATSKFGTEHKISRSKDGNSYTITTSNGEITVGKEALQENLCGMVTGVGMSQMENNWYGAQSQSLANYQHADAAAKSAAQILETIKPQVDNLTSAVSSSMSSMSKLNDSVVAKMSDMQISFDDTGNIKLDASNLAKIGKYMSSVKNDGNLSDEEKKSFLSPFEELGEKFKEDIAQLGAVVSQRDRAEAERLAANNEASRLQPIVLEAKGGTIEEKITIAEKKASDAKKIVDASATKEDKK